MADKYVGFKSLLMTGRAVIRKGNWLRVHSAGVNPDVFWLELEDKRTAKLAGSSILNHIREKRVAGECRTDAHYNKYILSWFEQLEAGGYLRNKKAEGEADEGRK